MKTHAFTVLTMVGLLAGCASGASKVALKSPDATAKVAEKTDSFIELDQDLGDAETTQATVVDPRKTGDFVMFSFEGTYRTAPLMLTQRVVDRTDHDITLEMNFQEKGKQAQIVRVKTSLDIGHAGEVLEVAIVDARGVATPTSRATYDNLIGMTVASTDVNDAELSSVPSKVAVGGQELHVTATTYRVHIGATKATMQTLSSDDFAWGDVGGEIKTEQGAIFYKATLVGMGADPSGVASIDATTATN